MINKFSSVGYICADTFLFAFLLALFLLLLQFSSFSLVCSVGKPCLPAGSVQQSGLPFFFIFFLFLFFSISSPCPPPLGKSSASSKVVLAFEGRSLDWGTGTLGFHVFSRLTCLCLFCLIVLDVASEVSIKKIWLEAGRLVLKLWRGVWLVWWWLLSWWSFCFFFGGPGVEGLWETSGKTLLFFRSKKEDKNFEPPCPRPQFGNHWYTV